MRFGIFVMTLFLALSACDGSTKTTVQTPDKPPRRLTRKDCILVARDLELRFYTAEMRPLIELSDVHNCEREITLPNIGKVNHKFVEFVNIATGSVRTEFSLPKWPDDSHIPEYWDPNVDCSTRQCSRE